MADPSAHPSDRPRHAFAVATAFLIVATLLGLVLRANSLWPIEGLTYGYWLHAHSHTAFLGWIYNAFFAVALERFVPLEEQRSYWRLFLFTQVATLGMLISFPFQGYARESIIFSTLHLVASGAFAYKLLRRNRAGAAARRYLAVAFMFLFASAAGPIALGPLAAAGLRESPWYLFSIYGYLHFQYNGWFPCFLIAAFVELKERKDGPQSVAPALSALPWLAVGMVLTLGVSALWMQPPAWVSWLTGLGGIVQCVGVALLGRAFFGSAPGGEKKRGRGMLFHLAAAAFGLKALLQALAALPALSEFSSHRFVAIAFLHLMFLVVVTPLLICLAFRFGWMGRNRRVWAGIAIYLAGVLTTQTTLVYIPMAAVLDWPILTRISETLFAGSCLLAAGLIVAAVPSKARPSSGHIPAG